MGNQLPSSEQIQIKEMEKEMEMLQAKKEMEMKELQAKKDMEMKMEMLQAKMEMEMEMLQAKMEMQMEMKMKMQMLQTKNEQTQSYLKLSFAAVTQRWLLELFFEDVKNTFKFPKPYSMSRINKEIKEKWSDISHQFNLQCEFPHLPGTLLYGDLSTRIHIPDCKIVYVGQLKDDNYKKFFEALCSKYHSDYEEVDEHAAAAGQLSEDNPPE